MSGSERSDHGVDSGDDLDGMDEFQEKAESPYKGSRNRSIDSECSSNDVTEGLNRSGMEEGGFIV